MNTNDQLRILSLFHYIVGGIHILFSSFGLIHFFIGISILLDSSGWDSGNPPPDWFGFIFAVAGGSFVLLGTILGILTIISGRSIARRTRRTFSIVIAAINCTVIPIGTILGVFTIVLLMKDETQRLYTDSNSRMDPLVDK